MTNFINSRQSDSIKMNGESSASAAANFNTVVVDGITSLSHDDDNKPFRFFGPLERQQKQRELFKSLASIPIMIEPESNRMAVICVSASEAGAVEAERFSWLINELVDHLTPRLQLLFLHQRLWKLVAGIPSELKRKYQDQFTRLFETQIARLSKENKALQKEKGELSEQNSRMQARLDETLDKAEIESGSVKSLTAEIHKLKQKISALKGANTKLKKKLSDN